MKISVSSSLAIALFLFACGGAGTGAGGEGGSGGEGATSPATGAKASNAASNATASSQISADATSSGSAPDTRLDPLEVGRSWTYDVTSTYPSCPAGMRTSTVTAETTVDGRSAYQVTSICGDTVAISVEGNVVESKYQDYPWLRMLDEPVSDGHTWTTTNGAATFDMRYTSVGSVTTPAGTFADCWQVTQVVSYTQTWTYCAGVGQVASEMVDLAGGTITYQLVSKSF